MTFNLESQAMTLAKIHHTGILSRTNQDSGAFGGKTTQERPGIAVTAMFRPHHAEHSQLRPVGISPEAALDLAVILLREPFLAQCRGHIKGSIR